MDLLQTVRKEGSRGGRGEFKWDDVKSSARRENYLGHSLMAPVGRWQQNRDLSWYAKSNDPNASVDEVTAAENARKEELARVKRAEEDAMAAALGHPVPVREGDNPNETPLGERAGQIESNDQDSREERRRDRKRHRRRSRERSPRKERRRDRSRSRDRNRDRDRDRNRDRDRRRRHRDDSRERERDRERDGHRRRERRGYSADRDGPRYQSRRDDRDWSDRREEDEYRSRRRS